MAVEHLKKDERMSSIIDDEEIGKQQQFSDTNEQHRHASHNKTNNTDSSEDGYESNPHKSIPLDEASSSSTSSSYGKSIFALCICMLVHGWLLVSVFPYSGFLAIYLIPSLNEETAGSYAGLLASSFMVGRTLTSYGWGIVADTYGRRFVLFASLGWSCLLSLLFGCSTSFYMALFWRFLLGVGNGILGTTKTSISELAYGNNKLETKGMGMGKCVGRVGVLGAQFVYSN